MPAIFVSLVIFGVLLLFVRTKIGQVLLVLWVISVGANLIFIAFEKEPYEEFIEENDLSVDKRTYDQNNERTFPWYASDAEHYYYLVPGFYRVISKDNDCIGFSRFNPDTWCADPDSSGDFLDEFKCYPSAGEGCGKIRVSQ